MFDGSAPWEDDAGDVFHIEQGEEGEQGDTLTPLLFALGQSWLSRTGGESLRKILAFLDDVHVITTRDRVDHAYTVLQHELWTGCHIHINTGQTQVLNRIGERPQLATSWKASPMRVGSASTRLERIGDLRRGPRVESCLEPRWAIWSTCPTNWRDAPPNTRPSSKGFAVIPHLQCACNDHPFELCIGQGNLCPQGGQTGCKARGSQGAMTKGCGRCMCNLLELSLDCAPPGHQRQLHPPISPWRAGTPQRHKNSGAYVLGEFGTCFPHDSTNDT